MDLDFVTHSLPNLPNLDLLNQNAIENALAACRGRSSPNAVSSASYPNCPRGGSSEGGDQQAFEAQFPGLGLAHSLSETPRRERRLSGNIPAKDLGWDNATFLEDQRCFLESNGEVSKNGNSGFPRVDKNSSQTQIYDYDPWKKSSTSILKRDNSKFLNVNRESTGAAVSYSNSSSGVIGSGNPFHATRNFAEPMISREGSKGFEPLSREEFNLNFDSENRSSLSERSVQMKTPNRASGGFFQHALNEKAERALSSRASLVRVLDKSNSVERPSQVDEWDLITHARYHHRLPSACELRELGREAVAQARMTAKGANSGNIERSEATWMSRIGPPKSLGGSKIIGEGEGSRVVSGKSRLLPGIGGKFWRFWRRKSA